MFLHTSHPMDDVLAGVGRDAWLFRVLRRPLLGLLLVDDLHQFGFGTTEAHLVVHDFIFHGVVQGGIEEDFHALSLDESHLDNALAESAVSHHTNNHALFSRL